MSSERDENLVDSTSSSLLEKVVDEKDLDEVSLDPENNVVIENLDDPSMSSIPENMDVDEQDLDEVSLDPENEMVLEKRISSSSGAGMAYQNSSSSLLETTYLSCKAMMDSKNESCCLSVADSDDTSCDGTLTAVPVKAKQILKLIKSKPLERNDLMTRILRRVIPSEYNPTGMETSISSSSTNSVNSGEHLGGVGKTVLAAMVASHKEVRSFYSGGIAWLDMGNREDELAYADFCDLLRSACSQLSVKDSSAFFPAFFLISGEHTSISEIRDRESFESAQLKFAGLLTELPGPVLIILDNIKHKNDLDLFKFDSPVEGKGSNVLATTRIGELVNMDRCINVNCLTQEESVTLLKREAGLEGYDDISTLEKLAKVCDNHPLTIRTIARWICHDGLSNGSADSLEELFDHILELIEELKLSHPNGPQVSFADEDEMLFDVIDSCVTSLFLKERKAFNLFAASITLLFWDETVTNPKIPLDLARRFFEKIAEKHGLDLSHGKFGNESLTDFVINSFQSLGIMNVYEDEDFLSGLSHDVIQFHHEIQREHSETICANCEDLFEIALDNIEKDWNEAMVETILTYQNYDEHEMPNSIRIYGLKMLPGHMMRAGLFPKALNTLTDLQFIQDRINHLGLLKAESFHRRDCEALTDMTIGDKNEVKLIKEIRSLADGLGAFTHVLSEYAEASEKDFSNGQYMIICNNIGTILATYGFWIESMSAYELGLGSLWKTPVSKLCAFFNYNVGVCLRELSLYPRSLKLLSESLSLIKLHGGEHILPSAVINSVEGDVFSALCDFKNATNRYDRSIQMLEKSTIHIDKLHLSEIQYKKACLFLDMGFTDQALQMFQTSSANKKDVLGPDDPSFSSLHFKIGQIYLEQDRKGRAAVNMKTSLDLLKENHVFNDETRVQMMLIKAIVEIIRDDKKVALNTLERTLQFSRFRFPYKKVENASLYRRIASLHMQLGELKQAFEKFAQSLEILKKCNCPVHLEVANVLVSMAKAHEIRESPMLAVDCLEEALRIQKIRLGECDKLASTLEMLGDVTFKIGQARRAEGYYEQALLCRRGIKRDTVAVAILVEKVGDILVTIDAHEEAMDYYHEALDIQKDKNGKDHANVATILTKIGSVWTHRKKYQKALQTLEEALRIRTALFGEDHPFVADVLDLMGSVEFNSGHFENALKHFWDSLRIWQLNKDQLNISNIMKKIGDLYKKEKRLEVALECYEESVRVRKAENIPKDESLAEYLMLLGNLKSDMKSYDPALEHYQDAFDLRCQIYGNTDDRVAAVLRSMGYLEFRRGSLVEARKKLERFISMRRLNHTDDSADFVNTLCLIGNIFRIQDHLDEANKVWKEAYDIIMANGLSNEVPQLVTTIENLLRKYERGAHLYVPEVAKKLNTEKVLTVQPTLGAKLFNVNQKIKGDSNK